MTSRAFLSSSDPETSEDICLICLTALDKDTKKALGVNPWNKLIEIAKKWQELDIPESDVHYNFTTVYKRIVNLPAPRNSNYFVHNNCQLRGGQNMIDVLKNMLKPQLMSKKLFCLKYLLPLEN